MEIQGYPNYLIYEDGRVEKIKGLKKGIIKSHPDHDGYLKIRLTNENGWDSFRIHRLIAIHYIQNPEKKPEVENHDRNPLNKK